MTVVVVVAVGVVVFHVCEANVCLHSNHEIPAPIPAPNAVTPNNYTKQIEKEENIIRKWKTKQ